MCRLAAFPPGFRRDAAIDILADFARGNGDGTGTAYVKNGAFIHQRWPSSLRTVVHKESFLEHMPYDGWTIAHLRSATHGLNIVENTHPFVKSKWAIAHNGIWSEHAVVKEALRNYVKFDGDTDSEVAAHLFADLGPKKFSKVIDFGGVFLALNLNGELWVVKTSGDLEAIKTRYGVLIASALPTELNTTMENTLGDGWYRFNSSGHLVKKFRRPLYSFKSFMGPPFDAFTIKSTKNVNTEEDAEMGLDQGRKLDHITEEDRAAWQRDRR